MSDEDSGSYNTTRFARPPASIEAIRDLLSKVEDIPSRYLEFLQKADGCSGTSQVMPYHCNLFSCEQLIDYNSDRDDILGEMLAGCIILGSDSGPSYLMVKVMDGGDPPVYWVDNIWPEYDETNIIASSLSELIERLD
jgi:hypothetical protein